MGAFGLVSSSTLAYIAYGVMAYLAYGVSVAASGCSPFERSSYHTSVLYTMIQVGLLNRFMSGESNPAYVVIIHMCRVTRFNPHSGVTGGIPLLCVGLVRHLVPMYENGIGIRYSSPLRLEPAGGFIIFCLYMRISIGGPASGLPFAIHNHLQEFSFLQTNSLLVRGSPPLSFFIFNPPFIPRVIRRMSLYTIPSGNKL